MDYTEDQVIAFHRALHRGCGHPEMRPSATDLRTWWDFLRELEPLKDTEDGQFAMEDLVAVLAEMRRQKAKGIGWSMRPSSILRDPEKFRDLILECRRKLRMRPPTPIREQRVGKSIRQVEGEGDAEHGISAAEALQQLQHLKGKIA